MPARYRAFAYALLLLTLAACVLPQQRSSTAEDRVQHGYAALTTAYSGITKLIDAGAVNKPQAQQLFALAEQTKLGLDTAQAIIDGKRGGDLTSRLDVAERLLADLQRQLEARKGAKP